MSPDGNGGSAAAAADWREQTRVFLQPIAPPSILGLFGFAGATFMVSAWLAGWFGSPSTPLFLAPFCATFGGLAQFLAGMWSYRARDGLATAMHGMWGAFWIAFGILFTLDAAGAITVTAPAFRDAFAYWFFVLAVITGLGAVAALGENLALFGVLATLAVGSALVGVGYLTDSTPVAGQSWLQAGGWVLVVSSWIATYTAAAMMIENAWGRVVLPLGKLARRANLPGQRVTIPLQYEAAEPGVRQGQ